MSLTEASDHHITVDGGSDPKTENKISCSCGKFETTALPEFTEAVIERHGYLTGLIKP